ncbi:MAG: SHOCT domain-containing protein, partial [Microbacterium sp.]
MPIGRVGRPGLVGLAARTAVVTGTANAMNNRAAAQRQDAVAQQQYQAAQQQAQIDAAAAAA